MPTTTLSRCCCRCQRGGIGKRGLTHHVWHAHAHHSHHRIEPVHAHVGKVAIVEAGHVWIKAAAAEALLLIHTHALVTIASDVSLFVILVVAGFHLLLLMMMMMFLAFGSFSGDYDVVIV